MESRVHSSLYTNCHHQITYEKRDTIPLHTNGKYGTIKKLMSHHFTSEKQQMSSHGKEVFENNNVNEKVNI